MDTGTAGPCCFGLAFIEIEIAANTIAETQKSRGGVIQNPTTTHVSREFPANISRNIGKSYCLFLKTRLTLFDAQHLQ